MSYRINLPDTAKSLLLCHGIEDDFYGLDTTVWNETEGDTNGTVAHDADGVGGLVNLSVTTSDNQEAYLASNEVFQIAADKPIEFTCRLTYSESATDDANVIVGLMDGWGANSLVDDGAGPKATFDGAVFYKVDGETRWRARTSNGTAYTDTELDYDSTGGGSAQTLRISIQPVSATIAEVSYWIDSDGGNDLEVAREYGSSARAPDVKHEVAIASQTQIAAGVGLKNGGANSELMAVDLITCYQRR